jgi:hypothetical protein
MRARSAGSLPNGKARQAKDFNIHDTARNWSLSAQDPAAFLRILNTSVWVTSMPVLLQNTPIDLGAVVRPK